MLEVTAVQSDAMFASASTIVCKMRCSDESNSSSSTELSGTRRLLIWDNLPAVLSAAVSSGFSDNLAVIRFEYC